MAKKSAREPAPSMPATSQAGTTTEASAPPVKSNTSVTKSPIPAVGIDIIDSSIDKLYTHYLHDTDTRTKLLDIFLAYLLIVAAIQGLYMLLFGNFPYNAFISGFGSSIGQFVLTVSLRMQTIKENQNDFPSMTPERAFAHYVICSLILHFFCINFIN